MNGAEAVPNFPDEWRARLPRFMGERSLEVAGYVTPVRLTPELLDKVALPLLGLLDQRAPGSRVLAGLAGVPGSGKSTFAALLQYLADALLGAGQLAVIGLDGWHFSNAVLDARMTTDAAGRTVPLRQRKGGPQSFDVAGVLAALDQLARPGVAVKVPLYDRRLHDPVADALTIPASVRIVVLEGNYIFWDQPPWDAVRQALSPRLFLTCDPREARARVIERHIRGGSTPEQAAAKYERNDRLNIELTAATSCAADWLIHGQGMEPQGHKGHKE